MGRTDLAGLHRDHAEHLPAMIMRAERELVAPRSPGRDDKGRPLPPVAVTRVCALLGTLPTRAASDREADLTIDVYAIGLDDVPLDLLDRAVRWAIKNCRWRPTVHELRTVITDELTARRRRLARLRGTAAAMAAGRTLPAAADPTPEERSMILAGLAKLKRDLRTALDAPITAGSRNGRDLRAEPPGGGLRSPYLQAMAEDLRVSRLPRVGEDVGPAGGRFDANVYDAPPMIDAVAEPRAMSD